MVEFPIDLTRYGFTWGPAEVRRVLDDKKFGVLISVIGKRGVVELRVTPGGRVSVHANRKPTKYELDRSAGK